MHEMVRQSWMRFNEPLEGIVNFMYLDVKGWVSTGMGNKIDETVRPNSAPSAAERQASLRLANQLNWYDQSTGAAASPAEVAAAWDAVKARLDLAPQGHRAFEGLTRLRVTNAEIARIVQLKLLEMERTLITRPEFSGFAAWPANAQLGTLSMSWGMGPMFRFPKFQAFVASGRWAAAAEECKFNPDEGTIRYRNKLDRMYFLLAQKVADQHLPVEYLVIALDSALAVQHGLWMLGYNPGPQDGGDGPKTQAGVRSFQTAVGLPANGAWNDPATRMELAGALASDGWTIAG